MDTPAGHTVSDTPTEDLRERLASAVQRRASAIALDAVTLFPFSGAEPLEAAYCRRVGDRLVELLASAVRDGRVDPTLGLIAELYRVFQERSLPVDRLFVFVYLTERSALDDLASDAELGATSEAWPLVAQLVRRASFDVLAAYVLQAQIEPTSAVLIDPLTTLHSRPVIETVLAKEAIRAARLGHTLALILIDMDRLDLDQRAARPRRRRSPARAAGHPRQGILQAARLGRPHRRRFDCRAARWGSTRSTRPNWRSACDRRSRSASSSPITTRIGTSV